MQVEERPGPIATLLQPLDKIDAASFYGRCAALAMLTLWSWFLFRYDYRTGEMAASFMHNILLPIHEAGHVFFRIFGSEFMMVLGGSLFQLLLPLGIAAAFIVKRRDNFGAALCIWWTSVSLVDLSPYIYDALQPQLPLIGGDAVLHDWVYLLDTLGQLPHAHFYGGLAHFWAASPCSPHLPGAPSSCNGSAPAWVTPRNEARGEMNV